MYVCMSVRLSKRGHRRVDAHTHTQGVKTKSGGIGVLTHTQASPQEHNLQRLTAQ